MCNKYDNNKKKNNRLNNKKSSLANRQHVVFIPDVCKRPVFIDNHKYYFIFHK